MVDLTQKNNINPYTFKDMFLKDEKTVPVSQVPKSLVEAANKEAKEKRLKQLESDKKLEFNLKDAQDTLSGTGISAPVTQFDTEGKLGGILPPRTGTSIMGGDVFGGGGLLSKTIREVPIVGDVLYQTEEGGGVVDVSWEHYRDDMEMGENNQLPWKEVEVRPNRLAEQPIGQMAEAMGEPVPAYSGTIGIEIPTSKVIDGRQVPLKVYLDIENQTIDELKKNIKDIKESYRAREQYDLPNLELLSTPDNPIKFLNYGLDYEIAPHTLNTTTNLGKIGFDALAMIRATQKTGGAVLDLAGLAWQGLTWLPAQTFTGLVAGAKRLDPSSGYYTEGELFLSEESMNRREVYNNIMENIALARKGLTDILPESASMVFNFISDRAPSPIEYGNGVMAWTEEDIAGFIEGKNQPYLERAFQDYAAGIMFVKTLDNAILPLFGRGPAANERFTRMLRGDAPIDDLGKIARLKMTKVKGWKTGYEHWKATQPKGSNTTLFKQWTGLHESEKAHWTNKAFSSFMQQYFKTNGTKGLFKNLKTMGLQRRYDIGTNIPRYLRETKFGEKIASFTGQGGVEIFGEWGYIPAALTGVVSVNSLYNTNFYNRALGTRVGSIVFAPTEFGKSTASGFDALLYSVSGTRPFAQSQYDQAFRRVQSENPDMSADRIDDYLRVVENIQKPGMPVGVLPSFVIVDGDGTERLIKQGDKEYDELQEYADGINSITDPQARARVVQSLKDFMSLQNDLVDLSTKIGWQGRAEDNPVLKLGASLYEVLDLFTTRSVAESMVERVDMGLAGKVTFGAAEEVFQSRKTQLDAIGELLEELVQTTGNAQVNQRVSGVIQRVKKFVDEEKEWNNSSMEQIKKLPTIVSSMYGMDKAAMSPDDVLNMQTIALQNEIRDMNLGKLARSFQKEKGEMLASEKTARTYMQSVIQNYKQNPNMFTDAAALDQWRNITRDSRHALTILGDEIYRPVLQSGSRIKIKGDSINELYKRFDKIISKSIGDKWVGSRLDSKDANSLSQIFDQALEPNARRVRAKLKNFYKTDDLNLVQKELAEQGIAIDVNDNRSLYNYYLDEKAAENNPVIHSIFTDYMGDMAMSGKTIVLADQALRNRVYQLQEIQKKGLSGNNEVGKELNEYLALTGIKEDGTEIGSLSYIIKKQAGQKLFREYTAAKEAYKSYVAPAKWGRFYQEFEQILRIDKPLKGTTTKDMPVERKPVKDMLIKLGNMIIENPAEASEMMLRRFGQPVKVGTETKWVITDDLSSTQFNLISELAINAAIGKRFESRMGKIIQGKLPDDLKKSFQDIMQGGIIDNNINAYADATIVPLGARGWDGTFTKTGELNFTDQKVFAKKNNGQAKSTLRDNQGNNVYKPQDMQERIFSKEIEASAKLVDKNKFYVQSANNKLNSLLSEANALTNSKISDMKDEITSLENFLTSRGVMPAPKGEVGGVDLQQMVDYLLKDGTGDQLNLFKDYLKGAKLAGSNKKIIRGTPEQVDKKIDEFAQMLVLHKFANDVLVDTGTKRIVTKGTNLPKGSKKETAKNFTISEDALNNAEKQYGPILKKFMGVDQYDKYIALAKVFAYIDPTMPSTKTKVGLAGGVVNIPTPMPIASLLSRGMNVARRIVHPRWVAADILIRASRQSRAGLAKTILTAKVTAGQAGQDTVIDVLHDMIIKGNFSEKNAVSLIKLMPELIYQSDLEVVAWNGWAPSIGVEPDYQIRDEGTAGESLIRIDVPTGAPTKGEIQFREQIMKEFGSLTNFRRAVENKDKRALKRIRKIQSVQQDSPLKEEMRILGIN